MTTDAADKNCNIGAQLQSITCIKAPKMFWEIYLLYDFWCAQTCSCQAVFGLPRRTYDTCCQRYIATCKKHLYRCTSTFSALNYCSGIFFNPSAIYTKWCTQTCPLIFRLFTIFDRNFAKIAASPSDKKWELCNASERAIPSEKNAENLVEIGL